MSVKTLGAGPQELKGPRPDLMPPETLPIPVLRLITRLNVGGPARQALILTARLRDYGYQTELASGTVGESEGELEVPPDLSWVKLPRLQRSFKPIRDARAAADVHKLISRRNPTIVHTHLAKAGALGRLAARRAGVPIIIHTFHGHVLRGYFASPVNKTFVEMERRLARLSSVLIAVSSSVRDELLDLGVGAPSRWRVVPLGLELDDLLGTTLEAREARNRMDLPATGPVIGIVGRLAPIKDHLTFLKACRHIATSHPDATFVVAGDGELRKELEQAARSMLGNRVKFLGWVFDLPSLYASLDVVVLTSRNEGTPVALIEAGASSRPVVATRVGGVPDVVEHGVTGFLGPPGDAEELASKVGLLLDNPEYARRLGTSARAHVKDRFSAQRLTRDMAGLYAELVEEAGLKLRPMTSSP